MLKVINLDKCVSNKNIDEVIIMLDEYSKRKYRIPYLLAIHYKDGYEYQQYCRTIKEAKEEFIKHVKKSLTGEKVIWKREN